MADVIARLVHASKALVLLLAVVCTCAPAITQQLHILHPPPDTPTPLGWVTPSSLALNNSPSRTTRCGLRDALPPPPPVSTHGLVYELQEI